MQTIFQSRKLFSHGASVLALGVALSWNSGALAQTSSAGASAQPSDAVTIEEIVVTSSRIDRAGFEAPTPTTVVGATELRAGARPNIGAVLNDLPQFRATLNPGNTGLSTLNSGVASADLRGLGATRTLVLLNGRRFVGDNDLNTVPFDLVKRVEVVTGGASAAWGSGAIAGVVNVILDDALQGGGVSVQSGVSSRDDGREFKGSAMYGAGFSGGRGHVLLDGEYYTTDGIRPRTARANIGGWAVLANPAYTATNGQHAFVIAPNVGPTNLSYGGLITSGVLAGQAFNADGTLHAFNFGTLRGASLSSGGEQPTNDTFQTLTAPLHRANLFARATYDLTDQTKLSGDLRYTRVASHYAFFPDQSAGNITISADNAFLPAAVRGQLLAAGQTSFRFGRLNNDFEFRDLGFSREDIQGAIGLDGRFGQDWRWNAYYTRGERTVEQRVGNARITANFNLSADSLLSPVTGQPICRIALTDPTTKCVPVNLFGFGAPSAAAANYINGANHLKTRQTLDAAAFTVRGEPLSLWAGPVSIAAGGELRREAIKTLANDPISRANGFTTVNSKGQDGSYTVKEAFGEVVVPLLKDLPLFQLVEFNGAARVSDYSGSGTIWSWKAGLSHKVSDSVRLRFVRSRDTRAASLTERFTAGTSSTAIINDPVTTSQYSVTALNGGNAALRPETSDTTTIGLVLSPSWAPGFNLSIDHYDINIDGAISTIAGQDVVTRCFKGNAALCALITRTGGQISRIQTTFINLANYQTKGTDFEISYRLPLEHLSPSAGGALRFRALADHVESLVSNDGVTRVQSKGVVGTGVTFGVPSWKGLAGVTYERGSTNIDLRARYVGGGTFNPLIDIANNRVSSRTYVDLSFETGLSVAGQERLTIFGSVANLLDKDPPIAGNPQFYDIVGRYFTLGARARF